MDMKLDTKPGMKDKVILALQQLGDTPDAVAAFLEGLGVAGRRTKAQECPIANYVKQTMGEGIVTVNDQVIVWVDMNTRLCTVGSWDIPGAVHNFIDDFDLGKFPQLERD